MSESNEVVPVGTVVEYHGSLRHGTYTVIGHMEPVNHADIVEDEFKAAYTDGVAYKLWPIGVEKRLGNGHLGAYNVRRTSFDVVE